MHFHESFARALGHQDVTDIFGVVGDGNLFIVDSFRRISGGKYHSSSHEASGVLAAIAYARTTGKVGFATVTHGPAFTNTMTALVEGVRSRTAIVLIAGDTPVLDRHHLQSIPQREISTAAGVGFEQVGAPDRVAQDLARAIRRSQLERRPIVLNVPTEFQWLEVNYAAVEPSIGAPQRIIPASDVIEDAVGAILGARRPLVLAGLGAISSVATEAVLAFAKRIGAPLATTLQAQGLFAGAPYDLGIFGVSATGVALETMLAADAVIVFGASLNRYTVADGSLLEGRTVIHVDTDSAAIGHFYPPTIGVLGDVGATARALLALIDETGFSPSTFASEELRLKLSLAKREAYTDVSNGDTIDIRVALDRVESAVPLDRTLVTDVGRFMRPTFERVRALEPRAFVSTVAFGSIGLGMASALGAGIGRPGHPVLLITGDGGFAMGGLSEFIPAVRAGVDLIVVLLNDGSFGAEHVQLVARQLDPTISTFDWPDFGPVVTAMGGEGYTVRTLEELDAALARIPKRTVPLLFDVRTNPWKVSTSTP